MNKDWIGNSNSVFKSLSANNHSDIDRESEDYYATDPNSINILLEVEEFNNNIWEPACGQGHMSKRLKDFGYNVWSTDLVDRGYCDKKLNFLECDIPFNGDIITNPPYKFAQQFVQKGLELTNNKLAMFLKIQFLEGKNRRKLFDKYPPHTVYVSSSRVLCAKNGDFEYMINNGGSAVCYCWFVWQKNFYGVTSLKWIN